MPEARPAAPGSGLAPVTKGWFVVNVRDAEWWFAETRGATCNFESEYGESPVEFAHLGISVTILEPGQHSRSASWLDPRRQPRRSRPGGSSEVHTRMVMSEINVVWEHGQTGR